jgi:F420-0:gamma-glutamyl ligase
VLRHRSGVLIVERKLDFVLADAGVDQSDVDPRQGAKPVLVLPEYPDGSAQLHEGLRLRSVKTLPSLSAIVWAEPGGLVLSRPML